MSDILADRVLMAAKGATIIKSLLRSYQELQKVGATLSTIQPSNIFLAEDLNELLHLGVQNVTFHGKMRASHPPNIMPYSNRELKEYALQKAWSPEYDLWAIGIVILEVLVGPKFVQLISTDCEVRRALRLVRPYLDPDLHYLIEQMTVFVNPKPVNLYLTGSGLVTEMKVAGSVEKMEEAVKECPDCVSWIKKREMQQARAAAEEQREEPDEWP